jgi:Leucine-rich repeat (LRR) protein
MRLGFFFLVSSFSVFAQEDFVYKSLDAALESPAQVYHLQLKRKGFTAFPKELKKFSNLKVLDLSKNKIKSFPDSLAYLSNLKTLNLSRNQIEFIPTSIRFLESLEELDLWDNYIESLPEELKELKSLNTLDIRGISLNYNKYNAYLELLNGVSLFMSEPCDCMEK